MFVVHTFVDQLHNSWIQPLRLVEVVLWLYLSLLDSFHRLDVFILTRDTSVFKILVGIYWMSCSYYFGIHVLLYFGIVSSSVSYV